MSSPFKDLFSGHSTDYAKYRPTYPTQLFSHLVSLVPARKLAWDCGTGNGQAAIALAEYFDKVIATDPGEGQIQNAITNPKVEYHVMNAETANLPEKSFDLITVAQAFHWFRHAEFFEVVRKVAKPDGILSAWCYSVCQVTPEIDAVVDKLYDGILNGYWEGERRLVETHYATVRVPFEELKSPEIPMIASWSLEQFAGYLNTWSALKTLKKKTGREGFAEIADDLTKAWGDAPKRDIQWKLFPRIFRL